MEMAIEMMIFLITIGMLIAIAFTLIGVFIGKTDFNNGRKRGKDHSEDVHDRDNGVCDHCGGGCDYSDSTVGGTDKEEHYRYIARVVKEVDNEALAAILRLIRWAGICSSPYEEMYLEEAAQRLEGEHEHHI